MNTREAVAAGILGASSVMITTLFLVLAVLLIIARWRIFTKAGEAGWKSIIPVYSGYVQWRIGWKKTGMFWLMLLLAVGGAVIVSATGQFATAARGSAAASGNFSIVGIIAIVMMLAGAILQLVAIYKLFRSFGCGVGWFIGYLFVPNIMLLVLGFGSSRYQGPCD